MEIINGKIETFKQLPTEQTIDLTLLEGWKDLQEDQTLYLSRYFDNYPQETYPAIQCGISPHKVKKWKDEDSNFFNIMESIKELHLESLASVQYKESYTNSKIRHQTLNSFGAKNYRKESTPQKVIHNNLDMNSFLKQLKD